MAAENITPMLKQYMEIKKDYPDAILFFRLGDFYEMFFDDARTAAPILEVVLTSRNKSKEGAVPLCGVPYHAMENYAAKLLRRGYKVAVCEQVEDPALAKGIVRREVTHVLTPATALEIESLAGEGGGLNAYMACFIRSEGGLALAVLDLAVGEFSVKSFRPENSEALASEFYRKAPREALVPRRDEGDLRRMLARFPELSGVVVTVLDDGDCTFLEADQALRSHFGLESIEGLGLAPYPAAATAAGVLLKHLRGLRKKDLTNIGSLSFAPEEDYLVLDAFSFRNLEVTSDLRGGSKGSLLEAVDETVSAMGRRLLKQWLSYPLIRIEAIDRRLDAVEELLGNPIARGEVRRILKSVADLARLNSKISLAIAEPHHLLHLKDTLEKIPAIQKEIAGLAAAGIREIAVALDPLAEVSGLIGRAIADDPAASVGTGDVIRSGYDAELDELKNIRRHAREIIAGLEKQERAAAGIPSLKVRYNKVFGYFIEVTNPHLKLVPTHYIRKQTLVNCERFITSELKELEDKILKAEERIAVLENKLYAELIGGIQAHSARLHRNAEMLAQLDVLAAGGEIAQKRGYCRPQFHALPGGGVRIEEGRHPVLEAAMLSGRQRFIPNDLAIASDSEQILIITGPNMGGKSTYLRQNALMVILGQAGYFVPARRAEIGLVDRIFTRIGAADVLIEGKSTFLVEMIETAIILNNATERSLILLDEIGRGTSTYDGLSIAWAVVEYIHSLPARPRTLFATHYHELTELAEILDRVRNYHISVREWQDSVIFLHKIVAGATDQSFGIHVAKIAGIPPAVIERAKDILLALEKKELNRLVKERITGRISKVPLLQRSLFPEDQELKAWDEIREKLKEIDISHLTPLDALNLLHVLKAKSDALS